MCGMQPRQLSRPRQPDAQLVREGLTSSLHLQKLGKQKQMEPKGSRRKEIMTIRGEIGEEANREGQWLSMKLEAGS